MGHPQILQVIRPQVVILVGQKRSYFHCRLDTYKFHQRPLMIQMTLMTLTDFPCKAVLVTIFDGEISEIMFSQISVKIGSVMAISIQDKSELPTFQAL